MDKNWTPQQMDAITARGGTVLVSAAAGSGKTAVLVERVIGRILDEENPIDAHRMLVVTFSNAAALEMKQRIAARISSLVAQQPENAHLRRQQLLLERAQISTIHAFCMDLIKSNFHLLGLPSSLRVGDEKELEVLRRDCAAQVIERFHERDKDGSFGRLVELLSTGRDDKKVFSTLFSLYDFVRSHPFYNQWLERKLDFYDSEIPVARSIWGQCILKYAEEAVEYCIQLEHSALEMILEDEDMKKAYYSAFSHDLSQLYELKKLLDGGKWDEICHRLNLFVFDSLSSLRGYENDQKKHDVTSRRKKVKDTVNGLRDKQFCATSVQFSQDMVFLRPMVEILFQMVKEFDTLFTQTKQEKNIMDFPDMEHYSIRLLVAPAGAGYAPTALARTVSQCYDEILIDEFQDTNEAQEMIFKAISLRENNLFMVGDVKQSIYRFRQAMPEIFMEKKARFSAFDAKTFPAKITLGKNFRSAEKVTGAINFFFSLLMSEKIGEMDYTKEEELVAQAVYPQEEITGCEIKLLDSLDYRGEKDKTALEAQFVAGQIAELLDGGSMVSQDGNLRRIMPKDICILLRSPSSKAQVYLDALTSRGIDGWAEPKSSYLSTREIAPVIALLRVIDNPLLDVDLASCMMSALFDFTADDMAKIRLANKKTPLYLAVIKSAQEGNKKAAEFLSQLTYLRQLSSNASAQEVIRKIYDLTDYIGKVQVMRMGESRRANLLMLVQYACNYHAGGYRGISGFISFIDKVIERDGDLAPASTLSEQANVVRVMSIHRSKGLEFPVVFLCDTAKKINKEDLNGNTLLHSKLGFACVRRDFELLKQFTTVPMQALRLELDRSILSEELRVLYVAMTRAKERLIITGLTDKAQEKLASFSFGLENGRLPPYMVRSAVSYLDWLMMAAVHHEGLCARMEELGISVTDPVPATPISLDIIKIKEEKDVLAVSPPAEEIPVEADKTLLRQIERRIEYQYPYKEQTQIPTKLAVSQIAKGEMAKSYRFSRRPAFMLTGGLTPAQRGNALHKFMQFADYKKAAEHPKQEILRLLERGYLLAPEAQAINEQKIQDFFCSDLAKRIFSSSKVYRELRFLAEVGEETLGQYTDFIRGEGKTAIQGVADCVFIEDGQAVIVDYKTDYVKDPQELLDRYTVQLLLYRQILSKSLGVPVKECIIYSFALSKEIKLDNSY